jgi:hypothetical protein
VSTDGNGREIGTDKKCKKKDRKTLLYYFNRSHAFKGSRVREREREKLHCLLGFCPSNEKKMVKEKENENAFCFNKI